MLGHLRLRGKGRVWCMRHAKCGCKPGGMYSGQERCLLRICMVVGRPGQRVAGAGARRVFLTGSG